MDGLEKGDIERDAIMHEQGKLAIFELKYLQSKVNLESALDIIKLFKPKKTILTNLHTDLDYNILKKRLPKNVVPAYDGLSINF